MQKKHTNSENENCSLTNISTTNTGIIGSIIISLIIIMYAYIRNCRWVEFLSQQEGDIHIKSGKEGIQPKHNVKPKFVQIKKPFQKFIQIETGDQTSIQNTKKQVNKTEDTDESEWI